MIVYLDTSALVKLYVAETGSQEVRELISRAEVVATSRIAYAEARAAFSRKFTGTKSDRGELRQTTKALDKDWPNYYVVEVIGDIVALAADLAEKHGLRAYDAVHLASAVFLRTRVSSTVLFSSGDERLNRAAALESLELV